MQELTETKILDKLKKIVDLIVSNKDIFVEKIENGFALDIPVVYELSTEEGQAEMRRQFVYITATRESHEGDEMYQIFTICAPEDERFYSSALMLNMNLPFGAIAISEVEGKNYFVLVDTYLAKNCTTSEIEKSVLTLAEAGDRMEKMLVGLDLC
ncbi:MAG: hypothetical protein ACLFQV_00740 [Vulcanimicrobiota bacterium]